MTNNFIYKHISPWYYRVGPQVLKSYKGINVFIANSLKLCFP